MSTQAWDRYANHMFAYRFESTFLLKVARFFAANCNSHYGKCSNYRQYRNGCPGLWRSCGSGCSGLCGTTAASIYVDRNGLRILVAAVHLYGLVL